MRGTERIDRMMLASLKINEVREWRSGIAHVAYPLLARTRQPRNAVAFGGFLEVRLDFWSLALVERQLGKARQSPQLRRGGEMA